MTDAQWTGASTPYIRPTKGDAWGQEAASRGGKGTQRIMFAGEATAPEAVASALGAPPGQTVIQRRRLILLDDTPVEIADSYWPSAVAAGTDLARSGRVKGGAPALLAEQGYEPADITEIVRTRPATSSEAAVLDMNPAEWVLTLQRTIKDSSGYPYEVFISVAPGRVGQLTYSMKVS